eukprot:TRINITY_DN5754_c0_g1_i1.p1 TRINITY_DN5754_c0_g1~~TRINITY_DN5754_c0_g1_i1.p1  ORF type:complete len:295 (-),score=43.75 TRINITY_DN5754_c0_g1_i1:182-1066(-)
MYHGAKLVRISEASASFEDSRLKARDYIYAELVNNGFSSDQITYHKFRWTDTVKTTLEPNKKTIRSSWKGSNILVWLNSTPIDPGRRIHIIGATYDSQYWTRPGQYVCSTEDPSPFIACRRNSPVQRTTPRLMVTYEYIDLTATGFLLELAILLKQVQNHRLKFVEEVYPHSETNNVGSQAFGVEDGTFQEYPVLVVFFDQESVDQLGSRIFLEYYQIPSLLMSGQVASLNYVSVSSENPPPHKPNCHLPSCRWNLLPLSIRSTADLVRSLLFEYDDDGRRVAPPIDQTWATIP